MVERADSGARQPAVWISAILPDSGQQTVVGQLYLWLCYNHQVFSCYMTSFQIPQNIISSSNSFKIRVVSRPVFRSLSQSIQAAIKITVEWVVYGQQRFIFHSVEAGSMRSECQHGWFCSGPSSGLQTADSPCLLTWWRAEKGSKLSDDSYRGTNPLHEGPFLMTSSNLNYVPKIPPSNTIIGE